MMRIDPTATKKLKTEREDGINPLELAMDVFVENTAARKILCLDGKGYFMMDEVRDHVCNPPCYINTDDWVLTMSGVGPYNDDLPTVAVERISFPKKRRVLTGTMGLEILKRTRNVSALSTDSVDESPTAGLSTPIGPFVQRLCICDLGRALDLNSLRHVKNLRTLKLDSRRGVVTDRGREDGRDRSFALYCLIRGSNGWLTPRTNAEGYILFTEAEIIEKYNTELNHLQLDAEQLGSWIGNQQHLKSLKLQYLNVIPSTTWKCLGDLRSARLRKSQILGGLRSVRLRRCSARLFWFYVAFGLNTLTIQEPTSLIPRISEEFVGRLDALELERTIPSKSFGRKGLLLSNRIHHNPYSVAEFSRCYLLEPLPDAFNKIVGGRNAAAWMKELTLQRFCVEGNDLTNFLAPFSSLTSLRLETTYIRILPAIQTLRTLVLRDIILIPTTRDTNVFRCICGLENLESLTLDSVVDVNPTHELRSFRVNSPFQAREDSEDIDSSIRMIGVNTNVKNLILGMQKYGGALPRYEDEYKVLLQRMFPAVSHLTFVFPVIPRTICVPGHLPGHPGHPVVDFTNTNFEGWHKKTPHTEDIEGQRFGHHLWENPDSRRSYYRGWKLQMVKFEYEGSEIIPRSSLPQTRRFLRTFFPRLRLLSRAFEEVPELFASIKIGDDMFDMRKLPEVKWKVKWKVRA
jgi:hypothetical protein